MNKFTLLCAAAAVVAPVSAYAQETTGSIRGTVTSSGSPVAGAAVTVVHEPSGTTATSDTDAAGAFNASGLRVGGPYTVTVTPSGGEATKVTDVYLTAGQTFRVPVEIGAPAEAATADIVVTGTRVARETSTGPLTALNRTEIEGVASINRDIRDLARRDPFVTMDLTNSRTIEVAGNNGRLNKFSVDGVQFSDDFGINNGGLPTSRGPVPYDAIEQFSVKVAPFDISEGDFQGGAVNVILRSGGNRFKGAAFFSYTDDMLTGNKSDRVPIELKFDSKQYGGFVSGPIIKDRLYFMFAYEKTKEADPFDDGIGAGFANQVPLIAPGDPRLAGPNPLQPIDLVNAVSATAQSVYGYDTLGLIQNAVEEDEKFVAKLDWNINDDHRASFTYIRNVGVQQFQQNNFLTPTFALGLQSNGYQLDEEVNSGVIQINSNWTDNFSTELRGAYRDYNRGQTPFGGREFGQFEVCLDQTSVGSGTSCSYSRLFFGPDVSRQTNALNTDNLSIDFSGRYTLGNHVVKGIIGYTKTNTLNVFLQRSLGDFYFDSIADYNARRANRLRFGAALPSFDPNDAGVTFYNEVFTVGLQDDWEVNDQLDVTAGVRFDTNESDDRPNVNNSFASRYGFLNTETFDGRGLLQPRVGFNWNPADRLIIRGGSGIFGGGTPDVFVSNSFSNDGVLTTQIDISRSGNTNCATAFVVNVCSALDNVDGAVIPDSVRQAILGQSLTLAPTNAIDPDLKIASQWRSTLSANYEANLGPLGDGWLFGADVLYSKVRNGYVWTDIRSIPIGTLPDGRTRYGPLTDPTNFQDLLMTNSKRGRSIIGVVRFSKNWDFGLGVEGSYTRSSIKDVSAITSATAGSLYSNNAFFDPNVAAYGRSIYEIKDQWKFGVDYRHAFFGDYKTRVSLFGEYRSGRPYSLTMNDRSSGRSAVFGTVGNGNRVLLYVPTLNDPRVTFDSTATETAFNAFVEANNLKRGAIVKKNSETSPDFFKVDLHISQEIPTFVGRSRIKLFADVENVLNLLNSNWGVLRQVPFPYTASPVEVTCAVSSGDNCTQYRYSAFTAPNETLSGRQSLYQIRLGARFEF